MFVAILDTDMRRNIRLGPTDTRDEASRLARSWIDAWAKQSHTHKEDPPNVRIERVDED